MMDYIQDGYGAHLAVLALVALVVGVFGYLRRPSKSAVDAAMEGIIAQLESGRTVDDVRRTLDVVRGNPDLMSTFDLVVAKCENCAHFDLEEGQAIFSEHRTFGLVTEHVSPAMMSSEALFDANGNPLYEEDGSCQRTEPSVPHKTRWADFGACAHHQEGRLKTDVCDDHKPASQES